MAIKKSSDLENQLNTLENNFDLVELAEQTGVNLEVLMDWKANDTNNELEFLQMKLGRLMKR